MQIQFFFLDFISSLKCNGNETYNSCGSPCKPKCVNGTIIQPERVCAAVCYVGCDCMQGYVRNSSTVCVLECDCN